MKPYLVFELAAFAINTQPDQIPHSARQAASRAITDLMAAILGGVPTQNAQTIRQSALSIFGSGPFQPWFSGEPGLHYLGAVFANCAAASALDVDDGHRGAAGHPGAAIIPAVLMHGLKHPEKSGELMDAVIVGYEVGLRVAAARRHHPDISFASGIWTSYGVAAAISRLDGLTLEQTAHAMAIAGTEAPGNLPQGACMASSVKGSSPWSTVTSIVAVERAKHGATGSLDLLDRPSVYHLEKLCTELGQRWMVEELYFKPYASCRYTHPVIDAILEMQQQEPVKKAKIDHIEIEIFAEAAKLPNAIAPKSLEDAQFSVPFTAALAALRGKSAFTPMLPQSLSDAEVVELAGKVKTTYPDDMTGKFPLGTPARVTLVSGQNRWSEYVPMPLGDATNPLSDDELIGKLMAFGKDVLNTPQLERLAAAATQSAVDMKPLLHLLHS